MCRASGKNNADFDIVSFACVDENVAGMKGGFESRTFFFNMRLRRPLTRQISAPDDVVV
jgi:hypothetical protein